MVMGKYSCSEVMVSNPSTLGKLDGHYSTLICCINCIVCLKKTENKQKKSPGWPIFLAKIVFPAGIVFRLSSGNGKTD